MSAMPRIRRRLRLIAALLIVLAMPAASATAASRYVVEFRARDGGVFGHT